MPQVVAQGVWTGLNIVLLVMALRAHRLYLGGPGGLHLAVWLVLIGLHWDYFARNLNLGQWNTSVYTLSVLGLALAGPGRHPFAGGVLVSLAASIKYMPAFFLIYFLLRREWRAAGGMLAGAAFFLLVLPTMVLGPQRHFELWREFREKAATKLSEMRGADDAVIGISARTKIFMTLTPVVRYDQHRVIQHNMFEFSRDTANKVADAFSLMMLLSVLVVTWLAHRPGRQAEPDKSMRLRELAVIGLWWTMLLSISPNVRVSYLIQQFTPSLAVAAFLVWGWATHRKLWSWRVVAGLMACSVVLQLMALGAAPASWHWWAAHEGGRANAVLLLSVACAVVALVRREDWEAGNESTAPSDTHVSIGAISNPSGLAARIDLQVYQR